MSHTTGYASSDPARPRVTPHPNFVRHEASMSKVANKYRIPNSLEISAHIPTIVFFFFVRFFS
jgi:hypothetical protein